MKKSELIAAVQKNMGETHDALQLVWDATNKGQRNKLLRNPEIKALMEKYHITTEAET